MIAKSMLLSTLAVFSCTVPENTQPKEEETPTKPQAKASEPKASPSTASATAPDEKNTARARSQLAEGRQLSKQGQLEEALKAFEAAAKLDPTNSTPLCEAGYAALRLGKLNDAAQHLRRGVAIARDPKKEAACRFNLGLVHEAQGAGDDARQQFALSHTLRPTKAARAKLDAEKCWLPPRLFDRAQPRCGLPDLYWQCGEDSDGADKVENRHEQGDALFELISVEFSDTRRRHDLLVSIEGRTYFLAELGWDAEGEAGTSSVEHVNLGFSNFIPRGSRELLVTVTERWSRPDIERATAACKAEHSDKDEREMCAHDLALERPPVEETRQHYLACAELPQGWTCRPSDEKPASKESFSRLFACPAP